MINLKLKTMRKITFIIALFITAIAMGQSNDLNPKIQVKVYDLKYQLSDKCEKDGEFLYKAITDTIRTHNSLRKNLNTSKEIFHRSMIPAINTMVKSAISYVRRFECVEEFVNENNKYDITGEITNLYTIADCKVEEIKGSRGKVTRKTEMQYESTVSISLTLTNLCDFESITEVFTGSGTSTGDLSSPRKAINEAINTIKRQIISYYNQNFPIEANILEFQEVKKDKVKKLYLDVGYAIGVNEDTHFNVFMKEILAGRTTYKKIGKLKVEEVPGEDICLCKVQRGSEEIKVAIDKNQNLRIVSYE